MAYCTNCGAIIETGDNFCTTCGQAVGRKRSVRKRSSKVQTPQVVYVQSPQQEVYVRTKKSKGIALLLCLFLGGFGAHKFYLHSYFLGTLYLLFCWTFIPLLWSIIDFIIMLLIPERLFHKMYDSN